MGMGIRDLETAIAGCRFNHKCIRQIIKDYLQKKVPYGIFIMNSFIIISWAHIED